MGKSKGPRVKPRPKHPDPPKGEPPKPLRNWLRLWARLKKVWKLLAGAVAAVSAVLGIYSQTIPEIELQGPDASPFALPYVVRNPSWLLSMTDVVFSCSPSQGGSLQIGTIVLNNKTGGDIKFQDAVRPVDMRPGQKWFFRCPITNATGNQFRGTIHPLIEYRTLGIRRTHVGLDQTWFPDANPARWVQGKAPPR